MPVYEFYCPDCHRIYSFFSRRVDTETRPQCPSCGKPELDRQASLFAISSGRAESDDAAGDDALPAGMDEEKLMSAMASMAGELEHLDDEDPKQAAQVMRKLFQASGLKMGDAMSEAIRRMEAGEDPDQIDAELGDVLEEEAPFSAGGSRTSVEALKQMRRDLLPPQRDSAWYPLHGQEPTQEAPRD
ncbi:zinc ribbon domain-containing protein [Thiorhodococcus mannitoliphagus]|uniref:Zinc ribbon domain-containing protein n=1 Tax=Thiorhodococcus mannitoliphagus TaxID=329406 RepID=A0A6P1DV09_9GAMM|nr:zinc ribbon domain-containing protein [Thiorhodococcus mannitoliphagus]NEX20526.1 zinc ribbon domain-containing protein [Thiorhodococcus mannitoliphagus]